MESAFATAGARSTRPVASRRDIFMPRNVAPPSCPGFARTLSGDDLGFVALLLELRQDRLRVVATTRLQDHLDRGLPHVQPEAFPDVADVDDVRARPGD